jgi:hypothetical protein
MAKQQQQPKQPASSPKKYLRIGDWNPDDPRSSNYAKGKKEKGLSVYELDRQGNPIAPQESEWAEADLRDRLKSDEPKYLVSGRHIGKGGDGEPILAEPVIHGPWEQPTGYQSGGLVEPQQEHGNRMAEQEQKQSPADQFTDPQMEQIQRYGQALGGGITPFDEELERELPKLHPGEAEKKRRMAQTAIPGEAQAQKMRAAQSGGSPSLGPTEAEAALAKQRGMLQQQAAAAGQQQAQKAQSQQPVSAPPPAPTGPQGVTKPYPAQAGEVGQHGEEKPQQEQEQEG